MKNTRMVQTEAIDERLFDFIEATDRVKALKDRVLHTKPAICIDRARILTKYDKVYATMPTPFRLSYALAEVLREMTIYIDDGELVVGNQTRTLRGAPFFPEVAAGWLEDEMDTIATRHIDPMEIDEAEKPEFREIIDYWKGKTNEDLVFSMYSKDLLESQNSAIILGNHVSSENRGHLAPDMEKVLRVGLRGIIEEIDERLVQLDPVNAEDLEEIPFLKSVRVMYEGGIDYANRYADLAVEKAKAEKDPTRQEELQRIAENCRLVPENPPQNFWQAIQSILFIQMFIQIESNGHSASLGRLDQYLYPFYKKDVDSGALDIYKAQELIACFFIKLRTVNKARSLGRAWGVSGYSTFQNVTIGGQYAAGINAENDLSYIVINAMENTRFPDPNLIARYWRGSSETFMQKCIDSMSLGFGMPAMLSDEVIIPSLLARGVSLEDAYNYCAIGCIEVAVPGKWGFMVLGMTYICFAQMLLVALNGGVDPLRPEYKYEGFTKTLADMTSFEEVMDAWRKSVAVFTRLEVQHDNICDYALNRRMPQSFISGLVDDCIKRGKPIQQGGAVYDYVSGAQIGVATLANSLAAIKKLVFDDKVMTGAQMLEALQNNFDVPNGEILRSQMLKAPKYGNDDDYVDLLAAEGYEIYMDEVETYKNNRYGKGPIGCGYYASTVTVAAGVPVGLYTGATPDGRKAGEILAEGGSPYPGTDTHGPTAMLKSVTKIPTIRMTGGQVLNIRFAPDLLKNAEERSKLIDLFRGFADLDGWHLQVNCLSSDILREAQIKPEAHRDLMVRVAGYCAMFTDLDKATQDEIIVRTVHTL